MKNTLAIVCLLLVGASVANAGTVYALDLRATPNRLLSFPVAAPANNFVANVTIDSYAMDFNSLGTTLYAVNVAAPFAIGTLNTTTGAYTSNATITGLAAADSITGLSVDPTSETFYLSANNAGVNNLYTLNPATGAATFVATMGSTSELYIDIAIGPTGQMYAHDILTDSLYSINKLTGASTLVGLTGHLANFAQGMDFDFADGNLYGTVYTGGGTGKFVRFDLTTGAGIVLADTTPWNSEMEMAINSPIPEPASLLLIGLGGLALLRRR
jgi:hypothetical protein